jgi:hypothetical protein
MKNILGRNKRSIKENKTIKRESKNVGLRCFVNLLNSLITQEMSRFHQK